MDILVWSGLGTPIIWKMMSFSNIYLYFWLKRKKVYPVFISGVFICILNGLRFYDKHYR